MDYSTVDTSFVDFLEGQMDLGLFPELAGAKSPNLQYPVPMPQSLGQDSLQAASFTDVLATVACHWDAPQNSQARAESPSLWSAFDTSAPEKGFPACLSQPQNQLGQQAILSMGPPPDQPGQKASRNPLQNTPGQEKGKESSQELHHSSLPSLFSGLQGLPQQIPGHTRVASQQSDANWGASFDLDTNAAHQPRLADQRNLFAVDTQSFTGPQNPWTDGLFLPADVAHATSSPSAEKHDDQQDARSPGDELLGSDREGFSDDDYRQRSHRKASRGAGIDSRKDSYGSQQDQRRTRKREKDRIEDLQSELQKVSESSDRIRADIDRLTAQLQEKEKTVRQVRAAEDSSLSPAEDGRLAADFDGPLRLSIFGENARQSKDLSADQVRSMTKEMMAEIWATLVSQMQILLQDRNSTSPSNVQRLATLQWEAVILHIRSALANPCTVKALMAQGALDGSQCQPAGPGFWQMVAQSLRVTPEQHARLSRLWQSYRDCMQKLMAVRSSITQHISNTMPDGLFGRSFAINFLKAHELMGALRYNLRQEHIALNELTANAHKILMPEQNATCLVHSWPFWPDLPAVISAVVSGTDWNQQSVLH